MAAAVNTVIAIAQSGIPVARMELLDERQMTACNAYSKLDYAVAPTIFFEFHGTPRGVEEQAEMVKALSSDHGAPDFRWSASPEERNRLWQARHDAFYAAIALRPGAQGWPTDVWVPISQIGRAPCREGVGTYV